MSAGTSPGCQATRHGSFYAYDRHRCRCPEVVERVRSARRRQAAARALRGFGVPGKQSAYVDEVVVLRMMCGDRLPSTTRERGIAVARLTADGLTARQIGERLGLTIRSVVRYRNGHVVTAREAS